MIENIIELTTEAIENGYSYERVLDTLRKEYGVSDHELFKIYRTMRTHRWDGDNGYEQFSIDIRNILDGEDINAIQSEMAKGYSDYIRRTAPWILSQD